jgi:BirA family transcriptional regulator, biotin operon repressor / biotin---[acetyl-CoA-carboxylase] ligase
MSFASELKSALSTNRFGQKLFTFDSLDSTNACAKALADAGTQTGAVVFSEEQTAGRGRLGRTWQSDPLKNLTFSIILRPAINPEDLNLLSLYVAVATAQAVEECCGFRPDCKWPNDLLSGRKKFAGILMEGSVANGRVEFVVAGIGINVNQTSFPAEIIEKATSLTLITGHEVNRAALLSGVLSSLELLDEKLSATGFSDVTQLWLSYASMINQRIVVSHEGVLTKGVVLGLSRDGGLILDVAGQKRTYYAGDVTIAEM